MGDSICKWRTATVPTVVELVHEMPKSILPKDDFLYRMDKSIYGKGFRRTAYQLACQLGLYYINDKNEFVPRFCRDISEYEARAYMEWWVYHYVVPNPYTRSFNENVEPKLLVESLALYLNEHKGAHPFDEVLKNIYGETVGNISPTKYFLSEYTNLFYFDKFDNISLNANFNLDMLSIEDRNNKEAFFQQFAIEPSDKTPQELLDQPLQLIYYGAPGTGKSFTIDKATNENNSVRTTFHPDSDYASFVGAYKPTMASMPVNAFVGTTVHHAKNAENEKAYEKKIVYKYVPQAFLKAYVEAWKRYAAGEDNPYYLVIEEINRGNCAQIFGDLFQLLDRNNMGCSSYAISADEDIAQFLREDENGFKLKVESGDGKVVSKGLTQEQRDAIASFVLVKDSGVEEHIGPEILNGSKLLLPPNLRIWATMNTSDQSLFPIDSAFKRRWNWEYMPIEYDPTDKNTSERLAWKLEVRGKMYYWGDFLAYINPKILKLTMSEDKQMGYFFAKPDKRGTDGRLDIISEKVFVNKVLFYLWTDVFKDYDLTEDPFVYENEGSKTRTAYRFTDFFPVENNDMLAKFVKGFKLEEVENGELKVENGIQEQD